MNSNWILRKIYIKPSFSQLVVSWYEKYGMKITLELKKELQFISARYVHVTF